MKHVKLKNVLKRVCVTHVMGKSAFYDWLIQNLTSNSSWKCLLSFLNPICSKSQRDFWSFFRFCLSQWSCSYDRNVNPERSNSFFPHKQCFTPEFNLYLYQRTLSRNTTLTIPFSSLLKSERIIAEVCHLHMPKGKISKLQHIVVKRNRTHK